MLFMQGYNPQKLKDGLQYIYTTAVTKVIILDNKDIDVAEAMSVIHQFGVIKSMSEFKRWNNEVLATVCTVAKNDCFIECRLRSNTIILNRIKLTESNVIKVPPLIKKEAYAELQQVA